MKVLNFGSLNLDYTYQVESILIPGETQASKRRDIFCGGKGLNQSIALAKAGVPVYHAGMIGDEGGVLLDACRENGVNTDFIRRSTGPAAIPSSRWTGTARTASFFTGEPTAA